jgi:acetaldehyde dehydrogenase (acetylating)
MAEAARAAGAPEGSITWLTTVTLEGTQELMKAREVAVILATGGMGLVRAAYSAGKPAYGVGPGNAPAYIERSADVTKAVRDIITGKTFDNGLLCSSENSVVVDAPLAEEVKRQFAGNGCHFLSPPEIEALGRVLVTPQRLPNPKLVGKPATYVAEQAGISVAPGTRVLIAELAGVGRDFPLSIEKLCPVLSFYVVSDWREGCERCKQILRYGGMGHTMSIHSRNEEVILQFGLKKPAFRIVVNTPTTLGSIGLTTSLDPSMTLGCGGWGGNITSDNISPRHLINVKRLAYETSPAPVRKAAPAAVRSAPAPLPKAPAAAQPGGLAAETLSRRIDEFLVSRGYTPPAAKGSDRPVTPSPPAASETGPSTGSGQGPAPKVPAPPAAVEKPSDFVCEDDVRQAVRQGRKIVIGEKTIVTPSARDLGEQHRLFVQAALPR